MKYLFALILWFVPVCAFAGFVQQTSIVVPSGTTGTIAFSTAPTPGNVGFIFVSNKNGIGSISNIVGGSNNWVKIADSGSLASTSRTFIYCGVINSAATSLSVTTTSPAVMQAVEFSGYTCTTDGAAQVANSIGATSITPTGLTTTNANDLLLANASHLTTETVTDGSTGYTNLNTYNKSPTMNADYKIVAATGTYTPTWSWATSSGAGAVSVAVQAGTNICYGADACVQFSPVARVSTGNPAPALTNNTTVGNTLIAFLNINNATATASVSAGGVTSWSTIGDSGNTGATFGRVMIFCGIITSGATTPTFSVSTGSSSAQLLELSGMTCTHDSTANIASSNGATSTGLSAYTTTNSNDVILALAGHGTAEAVTDNTGMNALTAYSANPPTSSADYLQVTKTTTITPAWSWTTSSRYGAAVVALEGAGTVQGRADFDVFAQATPYAVPTPTLPNIGIFYFVGQNAAHIPATLPSSAKGVAWNVLWSTIETSDGVYNWSSVNNVLSGLSAGHYLELTVVTGAQGTPSFVQSEGAQGVTVKWDKSFGPAECSSVFDPFPDDPIYISKFEAFITNFEAQYSGNSKMALVSISPASYPGGDFTLAGSTNATACPNNNYQSAWNAISIANGCSSGNETCWRNLILTGVKTLWQYEVITMPDQNLAQWITSPSLFAVVSGTQDPLINSSYFNYVGANPPANNQSYIFQEALGDSNFAWSTVAPYAGLMTGGAGAQAVNGFTTGGSTCASSTECVCLCNAGITYGSNNGFGVEQLYASDFTPCASTMTKINAALNGTPEVCNPD